jgi:nucleotide-binding universal stress UspA family protein
MLRHIVVPLDGSPFGEQALAMAVTLARKTDAMLHLVHVIPPPAAEMVEAPFYIDTDLEGRLRAHQHAVEMASLRRVCKRVHEEGHVRVEPVLLDGEVAESVVEYAARREADLIVATTHGRGPLARFWLGSESDRLVRTARVPVLLVHPGNEAPNLKVDVPLGRIVAAIDGTDLSESILAPVTKVAKAMGATVRLVRVVKPVFATSYPALESAALAREAEVLLAQIQVAQQRLEQEANRYLELKAQALRAEGITVQTRVDAAETPASAILEEARSADLVAVATHGRSGLSRLVLGSVADKVIRGSTVAVLVQHPIA